MFKTLKFVLAATAVATLVACGGGGGGGSTQAATTPIASTATFQLRVASANATQQTSTLPFTITGRSGSTAITGSGSVTSGGLTSTTFEGQPVLQKVSTATATIVINGTSTPTSVVSTSYYDSNYAPVGSSGTEYAVVQGAANIPAAALVNDTGSVYTAIRYANSTKATTLGTETVTFSLKPDTASTALLNIISVQKDNASAITATSTSVIRITPTGAATRVFESVTYPNGNNVTFAY